VAAQLAASQEGLSSMSEWVSEVHHLARSLLFGSKSDMIVSYNYADIMTSYRRHQRPSLLSVSCVRVTDAVTASDYRQTASPHYISPPSRMCVGQAYCVLLAVYERDNQSRLNLPVNGSAMEKLKILILWRSRVQAISKPKRTCFPHTP
jgi:hypothetical protein